MKLKPIVLQVIEANDYCVISSCFQKNVSYTEKSEAYVLHNICHCVTRRPSN